MPTFPTNDENKTHTTLPDIFRTIRGDNLGIGPQARMRDAGTRENKAQWGRGVEPQLAPASYPRIVLRDSLGYELDTYTTLQEAIYRAKWNVKQSGQAKTPLEWRLPKAPPPARPDLTRTCPPAKHPQPETEADRQRKKQPYTNILEFDVDDVGFVKESLQYLPYVPSLSFLRQEFLCGPKMYFQIVGTMLLHEKYLSLTEKRNAVYNFPGFCTGCTRMGLCYGCEKSSEPHYHEDKPVKTGGGFTYFKKDRPEKEIRGKNPAHWKIHHPDNTLKQLMEEYAGVDLEGDIPEEVKKHLDEFGGHREHHGEHHRKISNIPDFAAEMDQYNSTNGEAEPFLPDIVNPADLDGRHSNSAYIDPSLRDPRSRSYGHNQDGSSRIDDSDIEKYEMMRDQGQGQGDMIQGQLSDSNYSYQDSHGRHGNKNRRSRSEEAQSRKEYINIAVAKRGTSRDRQGHLPRIKREDGTSDKDQMEEDSSEDEDDGRSRGRSSRRKSNLYKPPPAFKLKKSPSRRIESKSPFSAERKYNIPLGSGFQVKKSDKAPTKFKDFRNVDVSWKEPKKFELKESSAKTTKFWSGPRKNKDDSKNKRSRRRSPGAGHGRSHQQQPSSPRSITPDSGLDSELMTDVKVKKKPAGRSSRQSRKITPNLEVQASDDASSRLPTNQVSLDEYSDTAAEYYKHAAEVDPEQAEARYHKQQLLRNNRERRQAGLSPFNDSQAGQAKSRVRKAHGDSEPASHNKKDNKSRMKLPKIHEPKGKSLVHANDLKKDYPYKTLHDSEDDTDTEKGILSRVSSSLEKQQNDDMGIQKEKQHLPTLMGNNNLNSQQRIKTEYPYDTMYDSENDTENGILSNESSTLEKQQNDEMGNQKENQHLPTLMGKTHGNSQQRISKEYPYQTIYDSENDTENGNLSKESSTLEQQQNNEIGNQKKNQHLPTLMGNNHGHNKPRRNPLDKRRLNDTTKYNRQKHGDPMKQTQENVPVDSSSETESDSEVQYSDNEKGGAFKNGNERPPRQTMKPFINKTDEQRRKNFDKNPPKSTENRYARQRNGDPGPVSMDSSSESGSDSEMKYIDKEKGGAFKPGQTRQSRQKIKHFVNKIEKQRRNSLDKRRPNHTEDSYSTQRRLDPRKQTYEIVATDTCSETENDSEIQYRDREKYDTFKNGKENQSRHRMKHFINKTNKDGNDQSAKRIEREIGERKRLQDNFKTNYLSSDDDIIDDNDSRERENVGDARGKEKTDKSDKGQHLQTRGRSKSYIYHSSNGESSDEKDSRENYTDDNNHYPQTKIRKKKSMYPSDEERQPSQRINERNENSRNSTVSPMSLDKYFDTDGEDYQNTGGVDNKDAEPQYHKQQLLHKDPRNTGLSPFNDRKDDSDSDANWSQRARQAKHTEATPQNGSKPESHNKRDTKPRKKLPKIQEHKGLPLVQGNMPKKTKYVYKPEYDSEYNRVQSILSRESSQPERQQMDENQQPYNVEWNGRGGNRHMKRGVGGNRPRHGDYGNNTNDTLVTSSTESESEHESDADSEYGDNRKNITSSQVRKDRQTRQKRTPYVDERENKGKVNDKDRSVRRKAQNNLKTKYDSYSDETDDDNDLRKRQSRQKTVPYVDKRENERKVNDKGRSVRRKAQNNLKTKYDSYSDETDDDNDSRKRQSRQKMAPYVDKRENVGKVNDKNRSVRRKAQNNSKTRYDSYSDETDDDNDSRKRENMEDVRRIGNIEKADNYQHQKTQRRKKKDKYISSDEDNSFDHDSREYKNNEGARNKNSESNVHLQTKSRKKTSRYPSEEEAENVNAERLMDKTRDSKTRKHQMASRFPPLQLSKLVDGDHTYTTKSLSDGEYVNEDYDNEPDIDKPNTARDLGNKNTGLKRKQIVRNVDGMGRYDRLPDIHKKVNSFMSEPPQVSELEHSGSDSEIESENIQQQYEQSDKELPIKVNIETSRVGRNKQKRETTKSRIKRNKYPESSFSKDKTHTYQDNFVRQKKRRHGSSHKHRGEGPLESVGILGEKTIILPKIHIESNNQDSDGTENVDQHQDINNINGRRPNAEQKVESYNEIFKRHPDFNEEEWVNYFKRRSLQPDSESEDDNDLPTEDNHINYSRSERKIPSQSRQALQESSCSESDNEMAINSDSLSAKILEDNKERGEDIQHMKRHKNGKRNRVKRQGRSKSKERNKTDPMNSVTDYSGPYTESYTDNPVHVNSQSKLSGNKQKAKGSPMPFDGVLQDKRIAQIKRQEKSFLKRNKKDNAVERYDSEIDKDSNTGIHSAKYQRKKKQKHYFNEVNHENGYVGYNSEYSDINIGPKHSIERTNKEKNAHLRPDKQQVNNLYKGNNYSDENVFGSERIMQNTEHGRRKRMKHQKSIHSPTFNVGENDISESTEQGREAYLNFTENQGQKEMSNTYGMIQHKNKRRKKRRCNPVDGMNETEIEMENRDRSAHSHNAKINLKNDIQRRHIDSADDFEHSEGEEAYVNTESDRNHNDNKQKYGPNLVDDPEFQSQKGKRERRKTSKKRDTRKNKKEIRERKHAQRDHFETLIDLDKKADAFTQDNEQSADPESRSRYLKDDKIRKRKRSNIQDRNVLSRNNTHHTLHSSHYSETSDDNEEFASKAGKMRGKSKSNNEKTISSRNTKGLKKKSKNRANNSNDSGNFSIEQNYKNQESNRTPENDTVKENIPTYSESESDENLDSYPFNDYSDVNQNTNIDKIQRVKNQENFNNIPYISGTESEDQEEAWYRNRNPRYEDDENDKSGDLDNVNIDQQQRQRHQHAKRQQQARQRRMQIYQQQERLRQNNQNGVTNYKRDDINDMNEGCEEALQDDQDYDDDYLAYLDRQEGKQTKMSLYESADTADYFDSEMDERYGTYDPEYDMHAGENNDHEYQNKRYMNKSRNERDKNDLPKYGNRTKISARDFRKLNKSKEMQAESDKQEMFQTDNQEKNSSEKNGDSVLHIHVPSGEELCSSPPNIPSDIELERGSLTSHEPDLELVFDDAIDVENIEIVDNDDEENEEKIRAEEKRRRRHRHKRRKRREAEKAKETALKQHGHENNNEIGEKLSENDGGLPKQIDENIYPEQKREYSELDSHALEVVSNENQPHEKEFGNEIPLDTDSDEDIDSEFEDELNRMLEESRDCETRHTNRSSRQKLRNKSKDSKSRERKSKDKSKDKKSERSKERHAKSKRSKDRDAKRGHSRNRQSQERSEHQGDNFDNETAENKNGQMAKPTKTRKKDKTENRNLSDDEYDMANFSHSDHEDTGEPNSDMKGNKMNNSDAENPDGNTKEEKEVDEQLDDHEKANKKKKRRRGRGKDVDFEKLPSISTQVSKIMKGMPTFEPEKRFSKTQDELVNEYFDRIDPETGKFTNAEIKDMDSETKWELVRPKSVQFGEITDDLENSVGGKGKRGRSMSMPLLTDIEEMLAQMDPDTLAKLKEPLMVPIYLPGFKGHKPKKQFKSNPARVKARDRSMSVATISTPFIDIEDSTVKSELEPLKEESFIPTPSPPPKQEPEPIPVTPVMADGRGPTPLSLRLQTPVPDKPPQTPPKRKEIVRKEKKDVKPRTPKPPSPIREPTPSPSPLPEEPPVTSREISFVFEKEPVVPELPPIEVPALPDMPTPRVAPKQKVKKELKLIEVTPELPEAKKKLPPPPKVGPKIRPYTIRKSKVAEAPVTPQELQQLSDPLDFLAKYCIINPDRLPFYERIFNGAVSVQTPRYTRDESMVPGKMVQLPPAILSEHELNMLRDLTVLNHAQTPRREGISAPEQYLEKLNYTVEFVKGKQSTIQDHMAKLQGEKIHYMAQLAKQMDRDISRLDYKVKGKAKKKEDSKKDEKPDKKKQKKKKKVDVVDYDKMGAMSHKAKDFKPTKASDITDEVIVSRMNDKMMKKVKKDPIVKTLTLEISRDIEKMKHYDQRIAQVEDEKDLVGLYCMDYYFSEQGTSSRPHEFRRQQSRLYQKLHPDPDVEMNIDEVEMALQQINNKLLTEKEFQYIYFILDLPKREKINFRLFSIIAALSEKVTQMDPMVRKLINKNDYNALDVKMEKSKELFDLLQDADLMPMGNAPSDNLAVELTAGGLTPEHTNYVLSKFDREGRGHCDFMDFVTYVPLFLQIHNRIISDPFNDSLDV